MANLVDHYTGDTVLFKASVYDEDGVTAVTPASATCSVWDADGTAIITDGSGSVGSGFAKYGWATGASTEGQYRAVLKVTLSGGAVKSEEFWVTLRTRPPTFTIDTNTDLGLLRLELGDDTDGDGVKPDGSNFTDAQLQVFLDREGSVMRALAAVCENLARRWARVSNITVGPRSEQLGNVAEQWRKRGEELRKQYGGGGGINGAFAVMPVRSDGYSENADSGTEFAWDE